MGIGVLMMRNFDYRFELLTRQIDIIQRKVEAFDSIRFKIKEWSITVFSGFIIFSAKEKIILYPLLSSGYLSHFLKISK